MELRDYLGMLRRGWATVLVVTLLGVGIAGLYVLLAPKRFEASTVLFVTTAAPATIEDLSQGASFASTAVITYAQIIDSSAVLDAVSTEVRPQRSVEDLVGSVTTSVREDTTLIDISVSAADPRSASMIANATAASAMRVIPTLQTGPDGRPLIRMNQVRPAVDPLAAASPNAPRLLGIGLVVGLFVGLAGTIVRQSLDTRVQRGEDLRQITEVPIVGVLPQLTKRAGLAARDEPTSPAGEAIRALRTGAGILDARQPRTLLITPITGSTDDALVSANLAWSVAQAGKRVLLVDLDLRASAIAQALDVEAEDGLAEVLNGQIDLDDAIRTTTSPMLDVLPAGAAQVGPSDLLSGPAMLHTLRRFEQEYEVVVLHAAPMLAYADAASVAGAVGGTFLVVNAGRTRSGDVSAALENLAHVHVRPLGLILSGVRKPEQPLRLAVGSRGGPGSAASAPPALDSPTLRHYPSQSPPRSPGQSSPAQVHGERRARGRTGRADR